MLIAMGSMKTPICITVEVLEGIKGTDPILKEIRKLDNGKGKGAKVYMFGKDGLVPLLLSESAENLNCAASLNEPQETATLLEQTIAALEKKEVFCIFH